MSCTEQPQLTQTSSSTSCHRIYCQVLITIGDFYTRSITAYRLCQSPYIGDTHMSVPPFVCSPALCFSQQSGRSDETPLPCSLAGPLTTGCNEEREKVAWPKVKRKTSIWSLSESWSRQHSFCIHLSICLSTGFHEAFQSKGRYFLFIPHF